MKVNIELNYDQLLASIKQLPLAERKRLLAALTENVQTEKKQNQLQELLLIGPTWSEVDYQKFLKTREQLNKVGNRDFD